MEELLESKLDNILEDENSNCYYVDFFPSTFGEDSNFFEFEEFLQKNYYNSFAKKISFIILGLVSYYDSCIYLMDEEFENKELKNLRHSDLTNLEYDKLDEIINYLVKNEISGLKIGLKDKDNLALLFFEGGLRLSFYNLNKSQKEIIEKLVVSQGFFFKKAGNE